MNHISGIEVKLDGIIKTAIPWFFKLVENLVSIVDCLYTIILVFFVHRNEYGKILRGWTPKHLNIRSR